jgi:hypothetical protein
VKNINIFSFVIIIFLYNISYAQQTKVTVEAKKYVKVNVADKEALRHEDYFSEAIAYPNDTITTYLAPLDKKIVSLKLFFKLIERTEIKKIVYDSSSNTINFSKTYRYTEKTENFLFSLIILSAVTLCIPFFIIVYIFINRKNYINKIGTEWYQYTANYLFYIYPFRLMTRINMLLLLIPCIGLSFVSFSYWPPFFGWLAIVVRGIMYLIYKDFDQFELERAYPFLLLLYYTASTMFVALLF